MCFWLCGLLFLSTLSLRRATNSPALLSNNQNISIHALLAESDGLFMLYDTSSLIFLSTLSLRRATCYSLRHSASCWYFYPRSPCGERLLPRDCACPPIEISIHALLAESDPLIFNVQPRKTISIHALLAESDGKSNKLAE